MRVSAYFQREDHHSGQGAPQGDTGLLGFIVRCFIADHRIGQQHLENSVIITAYSVRMVAINMNSQERNG